MNPLDTISRANDKVDVVAGLLSSKKEFITKQIINVILLFIILLVFGCLDFARLTFHFEYLLSLSFWGTIISKVIAGVCAFNIGINMMWETEIKKNEILHSAILIYNHLISFKDDDFEYYVIHIFNPIEKTKAYISQINRKIHKLNRFARRHDKLLYSSELEERQAEKEKNKYCIKRRELEELKDKEYIRKNLDSLKVNYMMVDPVVFELEIDGSAVITGVKTKGNIGVSKIKASSTVVLGMVGISMFITAIGLELNQEQFANQMVRFWHYVMKCAADVGTILWQVWRGMVQSKKIISSELTQPYTGRNKVLKDYYKWRLEQGKIDVDKYNSIVNYKDEAEVEMTVEEFNALKSK